MLVFIDDSCDAGFKLNKGSTPFFVIACVIFDDELEALKSKVAIKKLKRKLKFPDSMEFKFYKSSDEVRKIFLETIKPSKFRIRAIVIDKAKIRSNELKHNKNSFYSYVTHVTQKAPLRNLLSSFILAFNASRYNFDFIAK